MTQNGTVTDLDGHFTIQLKGESPTLVISYIGYQTGEIPITDQKHIDVVLEEESQKLNEVVVIGYGTTERKDLTGSVSTVKPSDEQASQVQNIETLLKGRTAGVFVSSNGAEPGAPSSIKIRGTGSLTSSTEPLYVVDGIIVNSATEDVADPLSGNSYLSAQNGITGIDPNDIESFEILKDASATAIYGSRGANGVIIITTKKGKRGSSKIQFSSYTERGKVVRNIEVLIPTDYAKYRNDKQMITSPGSDPVFLIGEDGSVAAASDPDVPLEGVNWADDTYRTSLVQKNRLSVSGGGEKDDY